MLFHFYSFLYPLIILISTKNSYNTNRIIIIKIFNKSGLNEIYINKRGKYIRKKYGIRITLTNPAYSSQECSSCHYIDKKNRNKDKFICLNCGHYEHSDYNSNKTLYNRVMGNVSLQFHNNEIINNIKFFSPKKMNHKTIKNVIHKYYGFE
jgi:hypothetical protein